MKALQLAFNINIQREDFGVCFLLKLHFALSVLKQQAFS